MSKSTYSYEETPTPKQSSKLEIWDMLSIVTLILTFCVGVYFVMIFLFPQSAMNPLKPSSLNFNSDNLKSILQMTPPKSKIMLRMGLPCDTAGVSFSIVPSFPVAKMAK